MSADKKPDCFGLYHELAMGARWCSIAGHLLVCEQLCKHFDECLKLSNGKLVEQEAFMRKVEQEKRRGDAVIATGDKRYD